MSCPEANALQAFSANLVDAGEREEIEAHVAGCWDCRAALLLLDHGGADTRLSGGAGDGALAPPSERTRGAALGRYLLLERIGQGGMGIVYAAYDPELDRKIALKLIRTDRPAEPGVRERLQREAQAMARLAHPNVMPVYDVAVAGDEVFIAMEWVGGGTLRGWLAARQHGWRETMAMFVAAGRGLAAAHAAGLVHRDFKPDNVLVGVDGRPRVTDFGLARADGRVAAGAEPPSPASPLMQMVTAEGALVGTPAYMSPEQLAGDAVDARSDVFSFCVALYEALYGERPFQATTVGELGAAIARGVLSDGRTAAVPAWVRRVLARALRPAPAERYPTMTALLADLERNPAVRRRRLVLGALLLVAAGIEVTLVYPAMLGRRTQCTGEPERWSGVWDATQKARVRAAFVGSGAPFADDAWARLTPRLDHYVDAWVAMRREACAATNQKKTQSAALLDRRIQCLDDRLGEVGSYVEQLTHADQAAVARAGEATLTPLDTCADAKTLAGAPPLPSDPATRRRIATLEKKIADERALEQVGRTSAALALAKDNAGEAQSIGYAPLVAATEQTLGDLWPPSQPAATEEAYRACILGAERAGDDLARATCWNRLAQQLAQQSKFAEADRALELARAALDRRDDPSPPSQRAWILYWRDVGVVRFLEQRLGDAIVAARRGIDLDPEGEQIGNAADNLALYLERNHQSREALVWHRRAVTLLERTCGPNNSALSTALLNLGLFEGHQNHWADALALFDRALAIDRAALPPGSGDLGYDLSARAAALARLGRRDEALPDAEEGLRILDATLPAENKDLEQPLATLASLYVDRDPERAAPLAERAVRLSVPDTTEWSEDRFLLARAIWPHARRRAVQLVDEGLAMLTTLLTEESLPRSLELYDEMKRWRQSHPAP